ncbi:MAG: LamG-like jellyroll fold domain-containing protein [Verrucomicrobiales bacterium]
MWLLLLLAVSPCAAEEPGGSFRAGASIVDITPEKFPVIVNAMFEERSADKVVDRLHARCLVLDDGQTRVALAVVDTCMLPRDLMDEAKELANKATGIATERMLVSATHTHSAPAAMGCLGSRVDRQYAAGLPKRITEGIAQAVRQLEPARVGWTVVNDWGHTFNRRWIRRPDRMLVDPFGARNVRANMHPGHDSADVTGPSGPVDPALSILAVQSPSGRPVALLANYSQHYYGSPLLSSDYFGRFAQHIALRLGADERFVGMMSQGTSGDLMWMDYSAPRKEIGYDAYAKEIAERVHQAYRGIKWNNSAKLAMAERKITLGFRVPDAERLAWARGVATKLAGQLPRSHAEIYALEAIHLHERPTAELKLQALRIGELGIVAIPNEVFAITGLKIKEQSPLRPTFNIELANGAEGYIPPPEQHKLGGYTTWPARTAGLVPEAEPRIIETSLALLEEVSGQPRRFLSDSHGPYARTVLEAKPAAYWRMNDAMLPAARDASGGGHHANIEEGVALWLPGVDSRIGFQPPEPPVPNAFSGESINRAFHFAGGRLTASCPLEATYSVELWLWNGLPNDARAVTGYVFSRGPNDDETYPGDHLGIGGNSRPELTGRLIFGHGGLRNEPLVGRSVLTWREWHHVVLARNERKVTVWLDGKTEIAGECEVTATSRSQPMFIGGRSDSVANFEGKLDEVAIYNRAINDLEVAAHFRAARLTVKE